MKNKLKIIVILLFLIPCFYKITYSFFNTKTSLAIKNGEIAEFIFEAKRTNHIELEFENLKAGENREYEFQVSNTKDDTITNVTSEYQITIKTFHFMPLLIELYRNNELVMACDEKYSRNEDNALVCNSDVWELEHNSTKTDKFNIKISFDSQYNSLEYTELVDYIDIDISSWQKTKNKIVGDEYEKKD